VAPSREELLKAHKEYEATVQNNYAAPSSGFAKALPAQNACETANAVTEFGQKRPTNRRTTGSSDVLSVVM
jgi:hypothetical protein